MATESNTKTEQKKAAESAAEPKTDERAEATDKTEPQDAVTVTKTATAEKSGKDEPAAESEAVAHAGDEDDLLLDDADEQRRGGIFAGAAAIVSAALGVVSLSGTSLGEMMQARKQLMGQIQSQMGGGGGDQIQAMYGGPWHMTALFNGMFALLAVIVGGVLLAVLSGRGRTTAAWVRPVALGGLIIGAIGLLVSGGMFLDLFAPAPKLPGQ